MLNKNQSKNMKNLLVPQEFIETAKDALSNNADGRWQFRQGYFNGRSIFMSEVEQDGLVLEVKIDASVEMQEEDETNTMTVNISDCIFTINLFNEDGAIDFSDDFERNIFDQLKAVEGEMILSNN
jgi:hypothetical protein